MFISKLAKRTRRGVAVKFLGALHNPNCQWYIMSDAGGFCTINKPENIQLTFMTLVLSIGIYLLTPSTHTSTFSS